MHTDRYRPLRRRSFSITLRGMRTDEAERLLAKLWERNRSFRGPHEAVAAFALVERLGELEALDALRALATSSDMNAMLREHAVSLLGAFKRPEDLSLVIALMRDEYIQDLAQLVVEQSWPARAIEPLIARLPVRDDDALCVIEALGSIGDERA